MKYHMLLIVAVLLVSETHGQNAATGQEESRWIVGETIDPITDDVETMSLLESDTGERLFIVCTENVTRVSLLWNEYLGSDFTSNVTIRLDARTPESDL